MIDPTTALDREFAAHPPALACTATDQASFAAWHAELFAKLRTLSGLDLMAARWPVEPAIREGKTIDQGDHTRQTLWLRTAPDYWLPFLVLRPRGEGPFVPMLAIHGHGHGMTDVAGIARDAQAQAGIDALNYAYAVEAVEHGYIVFAPDKRGFGSRAEPQDCRQLAPIGLLMGMPLIGQHTWDNMRLLDYLATRADCRPGPVGCIGLSGGGGGTMWLAAMDARIGAACISGHLGIYEHGQFGCVCNVVPDLLRWARRADLAGLIAPRPLFIESASEDECYSRARTLVAYAQLERIYAAAGAADRLGLECFEGHHEWRGRDVWPFLERWLRNQSV